MKTVTLNDLLNGQPNKQTKGLLTKVNNEFNTFVSNNPNVTSINIFLKSHNFGYISASDTLRAIYCNLTDETLDNIHSWGIQQVSDLKECLIGLLKELQNETDSLDYEKAVIALSDVLNYKDDEFVIYDEDGVAELDFDTLYDALNNVD